MIPAARDVHLPLHIGVVDRPRPVAPHCEIAAHARHVYTAGAVATDANRAGDVVDLDLTRAVVVDVDRPRDRPDLDAAGGIADPDIARVPNADIAGVVVDANLP